MYKRKLIKNENITSSNQPYKNFKINFIRRYFEDNDSSAMQRIEYFRSKLGNDITINEEIKKEIMQLNILKTTI